MFSAGRSADAIAKSVRHRKISRIWHMTRISKLESILTNGGLLSRARMDVRGIPYQMSSWGSAAKANDLRDYICCSFVPPWGMSRNQRGTLVLVQLQESLLWRKGTLFSPGWSSSNSISVDALLSNDSGENFDSMFEHFKADIPSPRTAEILVLNEVPLTYFLPIMYVYNEDARKLAVDQIDNINLPSGKAATDAFRFEINSYHFRGNL